jgi:uncharacterized protein (DUF2147 family)
MADDKENKIEGVWLTGNKDAHVKIWKDNGKFYGKIVWLKITHETDGTIRKDKFNPKKELKDKEIMGLQILQDFKYKGSGTWEDGNVYDPDTGNTYSGSIALNGPNQLKMRGYIGISLFGRTEYWNRVEE